jgi:hypothetical protein
MIFALPDFSVAGHIMDNIPSYSFSTDHTGNGATACHPCGYNCVQKAKACS